MAEPRFFPEPQPITLAALAGLTGATLLRGEPVQSVSGAAPLDLAGPLDVSFFENGAYRAEFAATRAGACFISERHVAGAPGRVALLLTPKPQLAFVRAAGALFPGSLRPRGAFGETGVSPAAVVHASAVLEPDVTVEPFAVIGARAEVGSGSVVGAGAVIGEDVRVGREGFVGPGASVTFALIGNRVIIHAGVRIGQDGFGYVRDGAGRRKIPQLGRVIIQDDVEIGAATTIDRGAGRDTVIGEGTKIDNAVHIAHNVSIGRHCVIVAHVGISGSTSLGDNVVLGGGVGLGGHIHIGTGAEIAGGSQVKDDVPAGARYMGYPARPIREWMTEHFALRRLVRGVAGKGEGGRNP